MIASVTRATPGNPNAVPTRSTFFVAFGSLLSCSNLRPTTNVKMQNGTLMKNNQRQFNQSSNSPPKDGPAAAASPPTAPHTPIATVRFSAGNSGRTSANDAGVNCAPPIACTRRANTNKCVVGARPHSTDPILKSARPRMNERLRPLTSAKRPAVRSPAAYAML